MVQRDRHRHSEIKCFAELDRSGPLGLCAPFGWRRNALEGNDFLSNQFSCFCAHPVGNPTEFHDTSDHQTFKKMLPRDERRFKAADLDGDQTATREEFTAFLHPEEFEHMKEIVVLVRQRKSLGWEETSTKATPKPCPFFQSENVLQPEGSWRRTLK